MTLTDSKARELMKAEQIKTRCRRFMKKLVKLRTCRKSWHVALLAILQCWMIEECTGRTTPALAFSVVTLPGGRW